MLPLRAERQAKLFDDLALDELIGALHCLRFGWERYLDVFPVLHHALVVHIVTVFQQDLPPVGD